MINKYATYTTLLVIREMQIKTTIRKKHKKYNLIATVMTVTQKTDD
jgi:hypothetical protein